jgi:GH35 family endo-1,4-beta-xylanase
MRQDRVRWLALRAISVAALAGAPLAAMGAEPPDVAAVEARLLRQAAEGAEKHRKGDAFVVFVTPAGQPVAGVSVDIRQESHEFGFGALLFGLAGHGGADARRPEAFKQRFAALFNVGILPFYWAGHEPTAGRPEWPRLDPVIEWALANGITVKGHPLVWTHTAGMPSWLYALPVETTETLVRARVTSNVLGFAGRIDMWDVVNEAVNTVPWRVAHAETTHQDGPRYRFVPIDDVAGWIAPLYEAAHEANPAATLVLNEFNQIMRPDVRQRFFDLVKTLRARRTPIHALGLQAHEPTDAWFPPERIVAAFDQYQGFGLPLQVTEFEPQSSGKPITGGWRQGAWTEEAQADYAEQMYRLAFGHPAVELINWWGFSDRDSWLPGDGIVTGDLEPKPVYRRLDGLINGEWRTRLSVTTDARGEAAFRGFYGRYAVRLRTADGRVHAYSVLVSKRSGQENRFRLTVRE